MALQIAWNTVIQAGFDQVTVGEDKTLWIGETGIFTVAALVAAAAVYQLRQTVRVTCGTKDL